VPGAPLWGDDEGPPPDPCPLPTHPNPEFTPPDVGPPGYRYYGTADYLHWWIRKRTTPVLLTTGTPPTTPLVTDLDFDNQERRGARGTFGVWLSQHQEVGLEIGGLWLAERSPTLTTTAASLARPFTDARTGAPALVILSAPGTQTGGAILDAPSRLWGGESNLRCELLRQPWGHLDLMLGFRYLRIEDELAIFDATTFAPGLVGLGGTSVLSSDRFETRNEFWGGQLGLEAEFHCGPLFIDIWGKIALGSLNQMVNIDGSTTITTGSGLRTTQPGGLLALASNSGRFERSEFSYLPEIGVNIGYQLSPHLRLRGGYTILFLGNVARAGDQIDTTVNPTQRPGLLGGTPVLSGPARPQFVFRDVDFWAQGFNVGLEFRF
jgi:hypothetical protein